MQFRNKDGIWRSGDIEVMLSLVAPDGRALAHVPVGGGALECFPIIRDPSACTLPRSMPRLGTSVRSLASVICQKATTFPRLSIKENSRVNFLDGHRIRSIQDAARVAYRVLVCWTALDCGLDELAAYVRLTQCGRGTR